MEESEEIRVFGDADIHDISQDLIKRVCQEDYFTVFPIGFRAAGKTMLMSSIFRFADRHATKPFIVTPHRHYPFNGGLKQRNLMVTNFDTGVLMGRNPEGTLELFGMELQPKHSKLDKIKLNFIDVSGEDIAKIKVSQDAQLTRKLGAIFNALALDSSPCVFLLITPFNTNEVNGDLDEDTLQTDFINFLKTDYPGLYNTSRLFVTVTKWDQNTDPKYTVERFIKEKRPSLYAAISGTNAVYGAYSIGKVLETKEGDI
ncbi:MAG: hypothetical protein ACK45H_11265, partial [Bacteroidota bacterium]